MRIRRDVEADHRQAGDDDGLHQLLSTFRYFARAHEPAAPRHGMLWCSESVFRLKTDCGHHNAPGRGAVTLTQQPSGSSTATLAPSHLYSVVLRCSRAR